MRFVVIWRGGRTTRYVVEPMPDPLWIFFDWRGLRATGALVWACKRCAAEFEPHDPAARLHAREHHEAALAREAEEERERARARAEAEARYAAARSEAIREGIARSNARRQVAEAERWPAYEAYWRWLDYGRDVREALAREGDPGFDYMIPILSARRPFSRGGRPFGGFYKRRPARPAAPEWGARLHRRHCTCDRCVERHPERLTWLHAASLNQASRGDP